MSNYHRGRSSVPSFLSGEQRINKLLAAAGFGSRRQVDELITEGRVEVDGTVITQVGTKVDADKSKILVDGEPLKRHKPVYFAVHKPAGFLCTNADPEGRPRVIELVPSHARLFPVGRLDSSSTGLILLTNDGELSQRLAHPKHGVPKSYFVVVAGQVDKESLKRLQRGIYLAEGIARVDGATIRRVRKGCTEIDITLSEGKNREIRRVLARLGHKVVVLRRVSIASLKLGDLPEGSYRPLTDKEIASLYKAVDDLRSARNQDRRERKKRSDERRGEIRSIGTNATESRSNHFGSSEPASRIRKQGASNKNAPPFVPFDEEADDYDSMHLSEDDDFESLPSLSDNPYRLSDDEDDNLGVDDAILVKDSEWDDDFDYDSSKTIGSVLGADDDEPGLNPQPRRDHGSRNGPSRSGTRRDGDRSRSGSSRTRTEGARRSGGNHSGRSGYSGRSAMGSRSGADSRSRSDGRSRFQPRGDGTAQPQEERRARPFGARNRSDDSSSSESRGEPRARGRSPYRSSSDSRSAPRSDGRRSAGSGGDRQSDSRSRGFSNSELGGESGAGRPSGGFRGTGSRSGRPFGGGSSSGGRKSAPRSSDRNSRGPKNSKRGPRPKR